ncbi:MAG TPA: DUF1549 domain-containing protein [Haliangiales bacterium]|nr:DUF1549 domain-containing protein [Haliangiales bacterium]
MNRLVLVGLLAARAAAAPPPTLDATIRRTWSDGKIAPAPPADDGTFLRRISLDLTGKLPSRQAAAVYIGDPDPKKKEKLVDRLLATTEYGDHLADVYLGLFGGRDLKPPALRDGIHAWLAGAFNRNERWDRMATAMLAATGKASDNGALGFLIATGARGGTPEAVAGASARVFLGLQAQCAQCHDHPYDPRFRQEDFYGLVAFFIRTRARPVKEEMTVEVFDADVGQAKMKVHKTGQVVVVKPKFLGRWIADADAVGRRTALAREIVGSPLFAEAAVNHMWALLFGRGVVQPWDDLGGENEERPPILAKLAADFRASGYDRKALVREIVLSDAYARGSAGGGAGDAAEQAFARATVRPLAPETLFQALVDATGIDDAAARRVGRELAQTKLDQGLRQFSFVFGDDEMAEVDRATGNVPQALVLFNGELVSNGARAAPGGELLGILGETEDPTARVTRIYLQTYTRRPTAGELQRALAFVGRGGVDRYEDLFYALLTSTEFTTNH